MFRGRFRGYRPGIGRTRNSEGEREREAKEDWIEGFEKEEEKQKRRPFRWKGKSREHVQYLRGILNRSFIRSKRTFHVFHVFLVVFPRLIAIYLFQRSMKATLTKNSLSTENID